MTQTQIIILYRPVLQRIAAQIVRCKADVDDLVQDTFLKWLSVDKQSVLNTKAYLIRSIVNTSLNHIKKLERKRETYFEGFQFADIAVKVKEFDMRHLDMKVNITAALEILQERLEPLERAVYLLREVFSFNYEDLQDLFKHKQTYCRQLFSRAKKKLNRQTQRIKADWQFDENWKRSFRQACDRGGVSDLVRDLQRDVCLA